MSVSDAAAQRVASLWQSSGTVGSVFASIASGVPRLRSEIVDEIDATIRLDKPEGEDLRLLDVFMRAWAGTDSELVLSDDPVEAQVATMLRSLLDEHGIMSAFYHVADVWEVPALLDHVREEMENNDGAMPTGSDFEDIALSHVVLPAMFCTEGCQPGWTEIQTCRDHAGED